MLSVNVSDGMNSAVTSFPCRLEYGGVRGGVKVGAVGQGSPDVLIERRTEHVCLNLLLELAVLHHCALLKLGLLLHGILLG